jgi:hypothetical protein
VELAAAFLHECAEEQQEALEDEQHPTCAPSSFAQAQPPVGTLARAGAAARAALQPPNWALVPHAAHMRALFIIELFIAIKIFIALTQMPESVLDDATIAAAMPHAPWTIWKRVPTTMRACPRSCPRIFAVRAASLAATAALAHAPGARTERLRRVAVPWFHLSLLLLHLVVLPMAIATETHARFGPRLRQPWQGGLRQLIVTLVGHLSTEFAVPPVAYAAFMLIRGVLPMLVRAAEAWPGRAAAALAGSRLLVMQPAWDVANAALCLACVVHLWWAQRRMVRKFTELADLPAPAAVKTLKAD